MLELDILSKEFADAASAAWNRARQDALDHGFPVFNQDENGMYYMERPDGRRFEIRFIPGAPGDSNYEIVRELPSRAA